MNENKRYKLFKLILIITILNVFGIFLYENVVGTGLFKGKPEFYIETIKHEGKSGTMNETNGDGISSYVSGDKPGNQGDAVLIIGDSNIYLMSRNKREYEKKYDRKVYWVAESGAGAGLIGDDLVVKLGLVNPDYTENSLTTADKTDVLKEIREKSIGNIVVMLGVNSLGDGYAKDLSGKLKKISETTGAKVSYISILPYIDKSKYHISLADILKFNSLMKDELKDTNIRYVDAYAIVEGIEGYKNETSDGLHYSKKIYDNLFDKIIKLIVENN